ncbi:hypothetical protein AZA_72500 [Nitrospirillum viridazoti Y2]|nr:hypothetical protein AZA_72500 [Nitrospirillum amazonense Y2]
MVGEPAPAGQDEPVEDAAGNAPPLGNPPHGRPPAETRVGNESPAGPGRDPGQP